MPDELVDKVLAIAKVTTLDEVPEFPLAETTSRRRELEGPEEVAGLLEVGTNSVDFVDEILYGSDTELLEIALNDLIVGNGNALLVDLGVTTLIDELTDSL